MKRVKIGEHLGAAGTVDQAHAVVIVAVVVIAVAVAAAVIVVVIAVAAIAADRSNFNGKAAYKMGKEFDWLFSGPERNDSCAGITQTPADG
jgi:hypothetical protein